MRMTRMVAPVGLALVLAAGWAAAGAATWPIPPVPENAYSVVRPGENPLVKPGGKVPVPEIVWEKVAVRTDHPRLMFNRETLPEVRRRFNSSEVKSTVVGAAKRGDALANALLYQISGREAYARMAIRVLLAGRQEYYHAYIFDWTYDAMTDEQRKAGIRVMETGVKIDRASGWSVPSPYAMFPDTPRPSMTPPGQWEPFYNWTFHDQDWAKRYAGAFERMIALAHHSPRMAESVRNYWEYSLKDPTIFFDYLRDGSYWQGYYWSIRNRMEEITRIFLHMKSACGIDYLDYSKHPYLGNFGRWLLYCSDAWNSTVMYNYGDGETRRLPRSALLASNYLSRKPEVAWLMHQACRRKAHWLQEVFYYDNTVRPLRPDSLPPSRAFPGTGLAVMRSGWEAGDIWTAVHFPKWFDAHGHCDVGSFILYCKSPLAPDSGYYCPGAFHRNNYYSRTVAHSTLTVRDPAAKGPLNDGCQLGRNVRTWSWAVGRNAWLYNQHHFDRGSLLAFETQQLYDYCAGDATGAYNPTPKNPADPKQVEEAAKLKRLNEFTRQVAFLRDGFFVVFDRVETPRPELEKRWLMQLVGEPKIDGRRVDAKVKGHIEDYEGTVTVSQGRKSSLIRCHTLLPAERIIRRVGGSIPAVPASALVKVPKTTHRMGTGSRWSWTDPLILYYNDPISGKKAGAIAIERDSPTMVEYEVSDTELYMKLDATERGRVDEVRMKLADYPKLVEMARDLALRNIWHLEVHYLPGYEWYNEGINWAPCYQANTWKYMAEQAPELSGLPSDMGSWRIEIYPKKPATRDYFLNVIRIQRTLEEEVAKVTLNDQPDRAEATVVFGGTTYVLAFAKKGTVGGHMRITDREGNVVADRAFAQKIVQKD